MSALLNRRHGLGLALVGGLALIATQGKGTAVPIASVPEGTATASADLAELDPRDIRDPRNPSYVCALYHPSCDDLCVPLVEDGVPGTCCWGNEPSSCGDHEGYFLYPDWDANGLRNNVDNCPNAYNPHPQTDSDNDDLGDPCDLCPFDPLPSGWTEWNHGDYDGDGLGNECDSDLDGDGIDNFTDLCPERSDPLQVDTDGDGSGDACDDDDDDDGVLDRGPPDDNCPLDSNPLQENTDGDAFGEACDLCPLVNNSLVPQDADDNGVGDACDSAPPIATFCDLSGDMVAWWTFDEGSGNTVADHLGGHDGTRTDSSWLNQNMGPFTVAVIPDTQYYSAWFGTTGVQQIPEDLFQLQTQWIADHVDALNIQMVVHLGDIVNTSTSTTEWYNADAAMALLDGVVPYTVAPGNHDYVGAPAPQMYDAYNTWFPRSRMVSWDTNQALVSSDTRQRYPDYQQFNQNNYQLFEVGELKFGVVNLGTEHSGYGPSFGGGTDTDGDGIDDDALAWAHQVVTDHPDRDWMVATHIYSLPNTNQRQDRVLEMLVDYQNLFDQRCHENDTDPACSPPFWTGGSGYLRTLTFDPAGDSMYSESYSPYCDDYDPPNGQTTYGAACQPIFTDGYGANDTASWANTYQEEQVLYDHPMAGFADNAMRFDGQDDGLVAADDDALDVGVGAGLADTARIRIRQKNGIYPILEKWAGPGLPGYRVFLDDGQLGVELSDGTTLSTVIAPATMALDLDRQWHFVAVSVHRDAPCAAIDLVVDSQTATFMACGPTGSLTNSEPLWIGHDANGAFSGDVDEVTFFDRPVTPGEIESLRLAHDIDSCKPVPATGTTTATELPREAQ